MTQPRVKIFNHRAKDAGLYNNRAKQAVSDLQIMCRNISLINSTA